MEQARGFSLVVAAAVGVQKLWWLTGFRCDRPAIVDAAIWVME